MTDPKAQADAIDPRTTLISRLEAATGPDRELDCEIAIAVGIKHRSRRTAGGKNKGREWLVDAEKGGIEIWSHHPPAYTGSLDAARTLLTEHCGIELTSSITFACDAVVYGQDMHASAEGATLPLALVIAALKARGIGSGE